MTVPLWLVIGWGSGSLLGIGILVFLLVKEGPPTGSVPEKIGAVCVIASTVFGWPLVVVGFLIVELAKVVQRRRERLNGLAEEVLDS